MFFDSQGSLQLPGVALMQATLRLSLAFYSLLVNNAVPTRTAKCLRGLSGCVGGAKECSFLSHKINERYARRPLQLRGEQLQTCEARDVCTRPRWARLRESEGGSGEVIVPDGPASEARAAFRARLGGSGCLSRPPQRLGLPFCTQLHD